MGSSHGDFFAKGGRANAKRAAGTWVKFPCGIIPKRDVRNNQTIREGSGYACVNARVRRGIRALRPDAISFGKGALI